MLTALIRHGSIVVSILVAIYIALLGLLTIKSLQAHVVYLHAIRLTRLNDLNVPEMFGFLRNQVTPFNIQSGGSDALYAWHILPVELYRVHEQQLLMERAGLVSDIASRLAFQLLRDDPRARLVIHMHGAAGTVGSGYRTPNYRALSAGQPDRIHVLTFDYRGFGHTRGTPSEQGVIADALAVVDWALEVAEVPPGRIVIFGQSLGTAVNMAIAEHYALHTPSVSFAGHILVAPFVDVPTLVSTYRIAGILPILAPMAWFPAVFDYLRAGIRDTWSTKDRLVSYVRENETRGNRYRITMIHAEDDYDIPWQHTSILFRHAIKAATGGSGLQELDDAKATWRVDLGAAGSVLEWKTKTGIIREEILKHGLHDEIMSKPVVTLAVMRMFEGGTAGR